MSIQENKTEYYYNSYESHPVEFRDFVFERKERASGLPYTMTYTPCNSNVKFENFKQACRMAVVLGADIQGFGFQNEEEGEEEKVEDFSETWEESWDDPQNCKVGQDIQVIVVSDSNLQVYILPRGTKCNTYQEKMIESALAENEREETVRTLFLSVMHNLLTEDRLTKLNKKTAQKTIVINDA